MLSVNKSDSTFEDTKEESSPMETPTSPVNKWKIPPIDAEDIVFNPSTEPIVEPTDEPVETMGEYIAVHSGEKLCTQCRRINPSNNKLCATCRSYHAEKMRRKRALNKIKSNPILNESIASPSVVSRSFDIMPFIAACYSNIHDGTFQLSGTHGGRNITCTITIKPRSNSRENSPSSS